ncbi:MAG: monovalent cation/H(+) antiporter subunit G [Alphaproteobacteria bacterium]|nr:monovalent cation/H(+) antiporter subunit G [Alphaproteobacteria bacterium]|tara:strand:+ start:739 stop:1080 length:342 start_codon:yes stop_codon:yes gene_type:complete
MEVIINLLSWLFLLSGGFFCITGMIGLIRLPDLFTRLHGASVTDTLGAGFIVIGLILQSGFTLVTAKLIIIMGLILLTSPVATHALAQAALHAGILPKLDNDETDGHIAGEDE